MNVATALIVALIVTCSFSENSSACDIPPDYHYFEYSGEGTGPGDIGLQSELIVIGQFQKHPKTSGFRFIVKSTLKNVRSYNSDRIFVTFLDVSGDQHILFDGLDNNAYSDPESLIELLRFFTAKDIRNEDNTYSKAGGILAGIFHGSDCERMVMKSSEQDYIVFLGTNDVVLASVPFNPDMDGIAEKITALFRP